MKMIVGVCIFHISYSPGPIKKRFTIFLLGSTTSLSHFVWNQKKIEDLLYFISHNCISMILFPLIPLILFDSQLLICQDEWLWHQFFVRGVALLESFAVTEVLPWKETGTDPVIHHSIMENPLIYTFSLFTHTHNYALLLHSLHATTNLIYPYICILKLHTPDYT